MRTALVVITLLAGGLGHAGDAPALSPVPEPQPVLARLQKQMASVDSVYLEFTQERHLQLFTQPLVSQGVMLIEQPGRIRWETTSPYQSVLLGSETSVAQFECRDGQWTKLKLGFPQLLKRVMDQMTLLHQGRLEALTRDYTLSVATGAVTVVTMVPRDEKVRRLLAALEVHLAADLSATREVVLREPGGDFTRIVFTRERRQAVFPPRTFDQTQPLELSAVRAAWNHAP